MEGACVADLITTSAAAGHLPLEIGGMTLTEQTGLRITSVQPFAGAIDAVSSALDAAHGLRFPAPGKSTAKGDYRAIWTGQDQAFLIGPRPDPALSTHAAMTDQSDAWCVIQLDGAGSQDVLARMVPVNLSATAFKRGHTARTPLGHMPSILTRLGPNRFEVMVFRSMASTAVHELAGAMTSVAARAALAD